jgi:glycosyltransferase involved in cell wall biosynthesis
MIACSVVVPTYLRPALLERCLDALAAQTMPRRAYEVIVADDAASVATRAQVERWARRGMPARYVAVTGGDAPHGPASARNAGWRRANGWLVAFTDDDTIPQRGWLRCACDAFAARNEKAAEHLDAAWGRIIVPLPARPSDYEKDAAGLEDAGFVTANCFVRRDVLRALDGFDERFTSAWREDSDLFFRLLAAGRCVEHLSAAVVVHPVRRARWGVSVSQQKKSAFDALLYKKHPALFARHVRPARPMLYYAIVLALLAACVGASAGVPPLAFGGAGAWTALTGVFAARRLRGTSRAPAHVAEMVLTSTIIPPLSLFWRMRGAVRHRVLFW